MFNLTDNRHTWNARGVQKSDFKLLDYSHFFEGTEKYPLSNGLTVILKEDYRFPVCTFHLWIKTGSITENEYLGSGISHFTEHSMFLGSKQRKTEGEISKEIESYGGADLNAHTSFMHTAYHFTISSKFITNGIEIMSDMIFNPLFLPERIKNEKKVILSEMDMGKDDPMHVMNEIFLDRIYARHPFRIPIIGYKDIFTALSEKDLKKYFNINYAPNNMILTIVGSFKSDSVKEMVDRHFSPKKRKPLFVPNIPLELPQYNPYRHTEYIKINKPRAK
ncbi:M16 family metallopeptidase, partial [Spirochaetota bacterium]